MDDLQAHLVELELLLQNSSSRKDADRITGLLCDDFREFAASGRVWDRDRLLAALAAETPFRITSEQFVCTRLSDALALLTYVAHTPNQKSLRSSLWRREAGGWRMLFHQGTPIPPERVAAE